jgi:hypothetical protein
MTRKNSFKYALLVGVSVVGLYLIMSSQPQKTLSDISPELPDPSNAVSPSEGKKNPNLKGKTSRMEAPVADFNSGATGFLPTKMEDPKLFESIQKNIKEMSTCLNMKIGPFIEHDEMNLHTLVNVMSPDLGDVVGSKEDWTVTDIKTSGGEIRRIFVQVSDESQGPPVRTLKYFIMNPNGQKEIPLSSEQSKNPTDTVMGSLEADGQLVGKSNAQRIYFQNGDDLSVVVRDGRIYGFELAHDQKTFKCTGFDSAGKMNCSCK